VIVLGTQIDGALPVAYVVVFVVLFLMQWTMRKRVAGAYRENQRMTNRMTCSGLHRLGQRVRGQPLQPSSSGSAASRASSAMGWMRRSALS
jgi:hypothetical protein